MPVRVESLADRIDFGQPDLFKGSQQLLQRDLHALAQLFGIGRARFERAFQAVGDRNQRLGERLDRVLLDLRDFLGRAPARVLELGSRPQIQIVVFRRLASCGLQFGQQVRRRPFGGRRRGQPVVGGLERLSLRSGIGLQGLASPCPSV